MWVASAASRMPDSNRLRKYFELEARATRWALILNSTPSALRAKSVSPLVAPEAGERGVVRHAAVQRELLGAAASAGDEEDEALALVRAGAVRARFGAIASVG